jgi:hypothetical protein
VPGRRFRDTKIPGRRDGGPGLSRSGLGRCGDGQGQSRVESVGRRQCEGAFLRRVAEPAFRAALVVHTQDHGLSSTPQGLDREDEMSVVDGNGSLGLVPEEARRQPETKVHPRRGRHFDTRLVAVEIVALGDAPAKNDAVIRETPGVQTVGAGGGKEAGRGALRGEKMAQDRGAGRRGERQEKAQEEEKVPGPGAVRGGFPLTACPFRCTEGGLGHRVGDDRRGVGAADHDVRARSRVGGPRPQAKDPGGTTRRALCKARKARKET